MLNIFINFYIYMLTMALWNYPPKSSLVLDAPVAETGGLPSSSLLHNPQSIQPILKYLGLIKRTKINVSSPS